MIISLLWRHTLSHIEQTRVDCKQEGMLYEPKHVFFFVTNQKLIKHDSWPIYNTRLKDINETVDLAQFQGILRTIPMY